MFPPNVWETIHAKLDCPRSRLRLLLVDKGMPKLLARHYVEYKTGRDLTELAMTVREAYDERRHIPAAKFLSVDSNLAALLTNLTSFGKVFAWQTATEVLWVPTAIEIVSLEHSRDAAGYRNQIWLTGFSSLSNLSVLEIRDAAVAFAPLTGCSHLHTLSLHQVKVQDNLQVPTSLQKLTMTKCSGDWQSSIPGSTQVLSDLTAAVYLEEVILHDNDHRIRLLLPANVRRVSVTSAGLACGQIDKMLTRLLAMEDLHVVYSFGRIADDQGPIIPDSLLHMVSQIPKHYFEWQWETFSSASHSTCRTS